MKLIVIDDDQTIRQTVVRSLVRDGFQDNFITEITEYHPVIPAEDTARQIMLLAKDLHDTVILDMNLGQSMTDGLRVVQCLRECFYGTFVIHSNTYFDDSSASEQARSLGIRFAVKKHAPELPMVARAAKSVAGVKFQTTCLALEHLAWMPILPYKQPTSLRQLFLNLLDFGYRFDGSSESVDWEEAERLQGEIRLHTAKIQEAKEIFMREKRKAYDGPAPCYVFDWPAAFYCFVYNLVNGTQRAVDDAKDYIK